jgi:hypothetical protein
MKEESKAILVQVRPNYLNVSGIYFNVTNKPRVRNNNYKQNIIVNF